MRAFIHAALLALLIGASIASPASQVSQSVQDGQFPSRSAPILLKPFERQESDSLAILIDRSGSQLKGAAQEVEMNVQHVADVATRVLGVQPVHPEFSPAFVSSSPFSKVKANVLIAVESIGEDALSSQQMKHLQQMRNEHKSFKLTGQSYPFSATQASASLATGQTPARHGIVGDGWFTPAGERVYAYSSAQASSTAANVADIVAQSFSGRSLTVAVSGSPSLALAHAVHPTLRAEHPAWNNLAFAVKGRSVSALLPTAHQHLELTFADVEHLLGSEGLAGLVKHAEVHVDGKTARVTLGSQSVSYRLDVEESIEFLAELTFVDHLLHQLNDVAALNALVKDEFPDNLAITFASLRGLREKYGEKSAEHQLAVKLLDAAIPTIIERLSHLYSDSLVAEVVVLGANRHSAAFAALEAKVQEVLPTEASDEFFPALYVRAGVDVVVACANLQQKLNVEVVCHPEFASEQHVQAHLLQMSSRVSLQGATTASNSSNPTFDDIAKYQIVLWTAIMLVAVVAVVIGGICSMENRRDTMLYSRFNPNWADRKRR